MRSFHCDHCQHQLFFENCACVSCGRKLAYLQDLEIIGSLDPVGDDTWSSLRPGRPDEPALETDPQRGLPGSFESLVEGWLPLTFALNSLNRSLGLPDGYPFVLSAAQIAKLRFVHDTIAATATAMLPAAPPEVARAAIP